MANVLHTLIVEDSASDARLVVRQIERAGYEVRWERVDAPDALKAALVQQTWDVILCDYSMPDFGGNDALEIVRASGRDIPFIFVSGTMGEDIAVEAMKAGAHDYVVKGNLKRLVSAIERELREAANRRTRREAEEALRESQQILAGILNAIPVRVFWKDKNLVYLGCNAAFARDAGFAEPKDIIGKDDYQMGWRDRAELYRGDDRRVIESGCAKLLIEEPLTTPEGNILTLLTSKVPLRDSQGEIAGVLGTYMDITERKQVEDSHARLAMAVEQAAETIVITDANATILHVNPAFEKITGYTRAEVIGQNSRVLKGGKHDAEFYRRMWAVLTAGEVWSGHLINKRKDGTLYEEDATISPVRNAAGKIANYVAVKRDVTEQKKLEAQVLRSQRLESIGALAGGVAHDINNALAPIMMASELLRLEFPDAASSYLDLVQAAAKRGADMVKQLLTFAKGAEGERLLVQPKHLLKEMQKLITSTFPKNIQLQTRFAKDLRTILGDATQLHQVLLNLCVNARDAMPNGGTLTLEGENMELDTAQANTVPEAKSGRYVVLRVEDTGTGIPPEIFERIFEPFFTTKGPEKGTGLGLSTVIGIVKSHGGFVRVYSTPEQGSTFAVHLPACGSGGGDTAMLTKVETTFRGRGETILVVDDEASVRNVLRAVLTKLNFKVLTASDGTAALVQVTEQQTELRAVITDLHMPHMDGLAFVRVLKSRSPQAGIILISGRLDEREANEFKELGVNTVLEKPFTQEKLVAALKAVFRK